MSTNLVLTPLVREYVRNQGANKMHMSHRNLFLRNLGRTTVATLFAAAATISLHAQQPAALTASPSLNLQAALKQPSDLFALSALSSPELGYSSSAGAAETATAEDYSFSKSEDSQPPPRRRRYGRPNYNDRMHNADGSSKFAAVVGAGLTVPVGNVATKYLNTSWKFQGGVGYNVSRKLGVMFQFDWDNFGVPGNIITSQYYLYNSQGYVDGNGNPVDFTGLDAHTHIWSFTLNPTFTFYDSDKLGAYAVVGGGFYHKVTNFTVPTIGVGYDYYYGPYQYQTNQSFDSYVSNAPGANGGLGITYKLSRFSNQKIFAEVRYVHTFNSARTPSSTNFFPGNASTSDYLPITVGLRF